jgi:hypothetical protein
VTPGNDWSSLHGALVAKGCQSCHSAALAAQNPFLEGTACNSYAAAMLPAAGTMCGPMGTAAGPLIVPGMPDASLLIQKLGPNPPCGTSMPQAAPQPLAATDPALVQSLRDYIASGAPPPVNCP